MNTTNHNHVIVIGSFLEEELVEKIRSANPTSHVVYEPELLPIPQYVGDHVGEPRALRDSDRERWRALVSDADIYFDFDWLDPAAMPKQSPKLRWIQATSAGIGSLMQRSGLQESHVAVTTAAGVHGVPLAEFAVLGALYFVKGVPSLVSNQRARRWEWHASRQLRGSRVLVVGLGSVGSAVAKAFSSLGAEVWGLGRRAAHYDIPRVSKVIEPDGLNAALSEVDVLVLACPLTTQTRHMIGRQELRALGPSSVLVNIARGPVVDEDALYSALSNREIAGACLDVFEVEPLPADDPMWNLENVIISPHSASTVASENESLVSLFLENLDRLDSGRELLNLYDRALGY